MVGRKKIKSKPTVVLSSPDGASRCEIRSSIEASNIIRRYPGFVLMDCNRPPGAGELKLLLELERRDPVSRSQELERSIVVKEGFGHGLGASIHLGNRNDSTEQQKVIGTGGGVICCLEKPRYKYFLVTVAHIFDKGIGSLFGLFKNTSQFVYDVNEMDFEDSSSDTDDSDPESPVLSSLSSSPSKMLETRGQACSGNQGRELPHVSPSLSPLSKSPSFTSLFKYDLELQGPYASSADAKQPFLDWALIGMTRGTLSRLFRGHPPIQTIPMRSTDGEPVKRDIVVFTTRKALVSGHLMATPTYVQHPENQGVQELWTIRCYDTLEEGDCGS
ncbi:uncharacterized protein KY384_003940 [Bacidia gigantensis]|uniref:uncharacterized protein n=1 Tax=Bacidia gigantensis TaxID=2732470 RepID=UPI001D04101A|nr:uncharacterized protein KY384_003940 [Bacidia gigantensis]KAG8532299.1 hypothetical protein KY384_003940 [Bacidia gigantensis]